MVGRRWVHVVVLAGAGCVPTVVEGEPEDETSAAGSEAGPVTTMGPATDSLGGTGMLPPATDGTTSMGLDDAGGSSSGDPPGGSTGLSTTGPTDPSTSDGTDPSSDTGGTSGDPTGTDATDTSDTDDTSDVVCEDDVEMVSCDALADGPSIFNAIGLGCEGDATETIPIGTWTFPPGLDPDSWAIASQFGTHLDPTGDPTFGAREGETFLALSSGNLEPVDADGLLPAITDEDSNDNTDNSAAPAPIAWPNTVNDLVWFQVELDVPPGVTGFTLDIAFFSEEFPEFVGTTFNDALVIWAHTSTTSMDVCYPTAGSACTVTGLWPSAYQPGDDELVGTGFNNDGSTGWRTVRGPANPDEPLQLTVALFDAGDTIYTAMALLDAFAWECDGCDGTPGNECGLVP